MKHLKKFMSILLTAIMVLAMCVPVMAYTITGPKNGHTYEVYQIFTGSLNNNILSNIKWGKNAKNNTEPTTEGEAVPEAVLSELELLSTNASASDTEKLKVILKYANLDSNSRFGTITGTTDQAAEAPKLENVPAGYYLIKDVDGSQVNKDDAYTKYIVKIVDNMTIAPKTDKPSVEKKVQENVKTDNTTGDYGERYNDTADYNIGDDVPFKLIGTVPDMSQYSTYKYTFNDTLSDAFDNVNKNDIHVYVSETKAGTDTDITSNFTITSESNRIVVSTDNLKGISGVSTGKFIIVTYSARLNANARVGQNTPGNINTVYLKYSNNPNQGGEGEEGQTPEDKVIVFTYQLNTKKIDGKTQEILPGVTFKLYKGTGENKQWAEVTNGKLSRWVSEDNATILTSDADGYFRVAGLDDGTYYIHEVQELPGYNKISDVEVVITANTNNGQSGNGQVTELESITVTSTVNGKATNGTGNAKEGTAEIEIVNNKGSLLPETGGIGTTIFYVVGVVLMLGAGVLLITKRRMSAKH